MGKNIEFYNEEEANSAMQLAVGRILKLGSRPTQDGDILDYEKAKNVFMTGIEFLGLYINPAGEMKKND